MKPKILLIAIILILISSIAVAEDLNSLNNAIKSPENRNTLNLLGTEGRETFNDITGGTFNVIRVFVSGIIAIKLFLIILDVNRAGEDSNKVSELKTKALWRTLALIVLINFWNIAKFLNIVADKIKVN